MPRLDLNDPEFQADLFNLPRDQQVAVLKTLKKLSRLSWDEVYRDQGLKWELIVSRRTGQSDRLYSLRVNQGFRALAYRDGEFLRLLSLHPDHDSAYR